MSVRQQLHRSGEEAKQISGGVPSFDHPSGITSLRMGVHFTVTLRVNSLPIRSDKHEFIAKTHERYGREGIEVRGFRPADPCQQRTATVHLEETIGHRSEGTARFYHSQKL